jgi:hypothetical protein
MKCVDATEVMRLFAGQLSEERAELVRMHFGRCAGCAGLRDEVGTITARLAHDPGEFDDAAAVDEVMTLIRMGKADRPEVVARPPFWSAWQAWLVVPVTAAATVLLMLTFWPRQAIDEGFQARGTATSGLDRWVSLQAFRATAAGYAPVDGVVSADDALAFTYLNRASQPLRHLAVVAIDARGEVFWYYPPDTPIRGATEPVELPEQVEHALRPGALRIFGLFSAQPLSRSDIEARLKRALDAAGSVAALSRLDLREAGQHSLLLEVKAASTP